jgi:CheY-like chemotaxis protein
MRPPKVLCIDDFRPGLETRKAFLEQFGFQVLVAPNGPEGLRLLKENQVDVVILDYRMPEMNGHEVALRIRQEFGNVPILLLSGYGREIPTEFKKIVTCHLMKGDAPAILIAALDEITGTTSEQRKMTFKTKSSYVRTVAQTKRRTG